MAKRLFFREFIKNVKEVGSVCPSSPFLVKKMLRSIDFSNAKLIVELGPGEGCITKALLKKMSSDAKLVVFETNRAFCSHLAKIRDNRLVILSDSASNMGKYVEKGKADAIVSSLPLTVIDKEEVVKILTAAKHAAKENGKYIQYNYSPLMEKKLESSFSEVRKSFALLNMPPAIVYTCWA